MIKNILILSGYFLLVVFIAATCAFVSHESKVIPCSNIHVEINSEDLIKLNREEILKVIHEADEQIIGKDIARVNTEVIELGIEKHQAIYKAEVFKMMVKDSSSYNGILGVRIMHRKPIVRVLSAGGRYYLDQYGERIPESGSYTANVLVVTGDFSEEYARRELLPFVLFINSSPFWKAQIEQVHIDAGGEVYLSTLVGDQIIEFGSLVRYSEKFRNLRAFYEQVLSNDKWEKYNRINLKYKDQVIAKKG